MPGWTTTRTLQVAGAADPDTVWQRYAQPRLWPTWAPHLTGVRASTPEIRPGTRGTVTAVGVVPAKFVVDAVDAPARRWTWTVRAAGIRLRLTHAVLPRGDGGSTTTLDVTGPAFVVLPYLPVAAWALRRLVAPGDADQARG